MTADACRNPMRGMPREIDAAPAIQTVDTLERLELNMARLLSERQVRGVCRADADRRRPG